MNYFPTPKSEFLKNAEVIKHHRELAENEWLRISISTAMLEMQRRASAGTDPTNFNACAASHLRMLGALDFIEILLNLAEQMQPGVRTDTTNLPGNTPLRKN